MRATGPQQRALTLSRPGKTAGLPLLQCHGAVQTAWVLGDIAGSFYIKMSVLLTGASWRADLSVVPRIEESETPIFLQYVDTA